MTQGYIIVATGPLKFVEMAANLAASIRVMDPARAICLVHDAGLAIPSELAPLFDDYVQLAPDPEYPTVMTKIKLFDLSPYDETMFVDADCLMVKRDIDLYWEKSAGRHFSITGEKITTGEWKGYQIPDLMKQEGADYIVQMNSGVFYFDKSEQSREFFAGINKFYLERKKFLPVSINNGTRKLSDELFFGVYMGKCHMTPMANDPHSNNSWMVTTYHALGCSFKPDVDRSVLYKPTGYLFGVRYIPTGFRRLSPTFAHFVALRPVALYNRLAAMFRARALARPERRRAA